MYVRTLYNIQYMYVCRSMIIVVWTAILLVLISGVSLRGHCSVFNDYNTSLNRATDTSE